MYRLSTFFYSIPHFVKYKDKESYISQSMLRSPFSFFKTGRVKLGLNLLLAIMLLFAGKLNAQTTLTPWSNNKTVTSGSYSLSGKQTISGTLIISGDVTIILMNGCDWEIKSGIRVNSGNKLTINSQSTGVNMGKLIVTGASYSAGIGSSEGNNCGNITINGGIITATGSSAGERPGAGAGIGGSGSNSGNGYYVGGGGGNIIINGGRITATGGKGKNGNVDYDYGGGGAGAGIGGGGGTGNNSSGKGGNGGTITINGGTITAKGGAGGKGGNAQPVAATGKGGGGAGAGIGGGGGGGGAGANGSGAGGGSIGSDNSIFIYGGSVVADGGSAGSGGSTVATGGGAGGGGGCGAGIGGGGGGGAAGMDGMFNSNKGSAGACGSGIGNGGIGGQGGSGGRLGGGGLGGGIAGTTYFSCASITAKDGSGTKFNLYSVSYHINGGTGTTPDCQQGGTGFSVKLPDGNGLKRCGYIFGGWNTKNDGTGYTYSGTYPPTGDITLYAKWNALSIAITSTGLSNLKVDQSVNNASIKYELTGSTYENTIIASDFEVYYLPEGLKQEVVRTSSTVVTVKISETPKYHNVNSTIIVAPTSIPARNVTGAKCDITLTGTVTISSVAKGTGATVSNAPSAVSEATTHNCITVNPVTIPNNPNNQTVQYAINTSTTTPTDGWQNDITFCDLKPYTGYYVFARSAENENYSAGSSLRSAIIRTLSTPTIAVSSNGLTGLKVDQQVGSNASIIYTLNNGIYVNPITTEDFTVGNLPKGLRQDTVLRTSDKVVTVVISGTPEKYNANSTIVVSSSTRIPERNVWSATEPIAVTGSASVSAVAKGNGATISSAPSVQSEGTNSITLNTVTILLPDPGNQTVEYALNTLTTIPTDGWQSSTIFSGLDLNADYYAYARSAENDNYNAGPAQQSAIRTTDAHIAVSTNGLTNLKVGQEAVSASIVYTLTNGVYDSPITPEDFAVGNLPGDLRQEVVRTNATVVTVSILGTPNNYAESARTINIPGIIPARNVTGVTNAITSSGTVIASSVAKGDGAAVSNAPVVSEITQNSITIYSVSIPNNPGYQIVEYSINTSSSVPTGGWQNDRTFNGLNPNTTYYVFARSAENANYNVGQLTQNTEIVTSPIQIVNAQTPIINVFPQPSTFVQNAVLSELSIAAYVSDGGELTYQWYSNTEFSTEGGTAISEATGTSYFPSTTTIGLKYYYVVVTNTNRNVNGIQIAITTSNVVTITVEPKPIQVTGIKLNKNTLTLKIGDMEQLIYTFEPANATNQNVIWSSSNEDVAFVDDNGIVIALDAGMALITVTTQDGPHLANCTVTVELSTGNDLPASATLHAWTVGSTLHVNGLTLGEVWRVYNMNGHTIYHATAEETEAKIALPGQRIYMVRSGEHTVKVVVK